MISHSRTYPLVSVSKTLDLSRVHASLTSYWTCPTFRLVLTSALSAIENIFSWAFNLECFYQLRQILLITSALFDSVLKCKGSLDSLVK